MSAEAPMTGRSRRVSGHALQHEGRPVMDHACCGLDISHGQRNPYDQHGHGLCSCGAMSLHLLTTAARQRWHRQHKVDVVSVTASPQATP